MQFYNYFNFFYLKKKKYVFVILNIWKSFFSSNNNLIFNVLYKCTKLDIKFSIEFFFNINIYKINTSINKKLKKKKAYVYYFG